MTTGVGIDLGKRSFAVVLMLRHQSQYARISNDAAGFAALHTWLEQHQMRRLHAGMEATGRYWEGLAHWLFEHGHQVSVINPARIKAFAAVVGTRSKTDRVDARLIALYTQQQTPRRWSPPDPARLRLQELTRYRTSVQQMRQQERNRLQAGVHDPLIRAWLKERIQHLSHPLKQIEQEICLHIDAHDHLRRHSQLLRSIPFIGPITAAVLLAELPDIRGFARASQLVAFAGVDPSRQQSGTSLNKSGRMSKQGNARGRAALFFPAVNGKNRAACFQSWVERLRRDGQPPMSIVGALIGKLLHLVFGSLKHEQPFDPDYTRRLPISACLFRRYLHHGIVAVGALREAPTSALKNSLCFKDPLRSLRPLRFKFLSDSPCL